MTGVRNILDTPVRIREASESDLDSLDQFLDSFATKKEILPRSENELRILIQQGFIAEHVDRIVGFAAIEIYSRKLAEVQALAVASEYRGQGIGKALVRHCVIRSREQGILELMAITSSDDLFRDCGFDYSLPNQKRALFYQTREYHTE